MAARVARCDINLRETAKAATAITAPVSANETIAQSTNIWGKAGQISTGYGDTTAVTAHATHAKNTQFATKEPTATWLSFRARGHGKAPSAIATALNTT